MLSKITAATWMIMIAKATGTIQAVNQCSRSPLRMAADMRNGDREHWFTAWMVPVAFAIMIIHVAAVIFDSIPLFGHIVGSWQVAALPSPYDKMQENIVLTICGVAGVSS